MLRRAIGSLCILLVMLGAGLSSADLAAQTPPPALDVWNTEQVGFLPGPYHRIEIAGDFVYLSHLDQLHIINVTDPKRSYEVGVYSIPGQGFSDLHVQGNYLYVTTKSCVGPNCTVPTFLRILNIVDPAHPVEIGSKELPFAWDIEVVDHYVYVTNYYGRLDILDVTDPAQPRPVGTFAQDDYQALGVAVAGSYAYIAMKPAFCGKICPPSKVFIVNIADPAHPIVVSSIPVVEPWDVVVQGTFAYVVGGQTLILNVSNPTRPTVESEVLVPRFGSRGVQVVGEYVYYAALTGGVQIYNIGNPRHSQQVGFFVADDSITWDVVVRESLVYVADQTGFYIVRFTGEGWAIHLPLVSR